MMIQTALSFESGMLHLFVLAAMRHSMISIRVRLEMKFRGTDLNLLSIAQHCLGTKEEDSLQFPTA